MVAPASANAISVPITSAATTRYAVATEKSGRDRMPLRATPIAASTPISTTRTASEIMTVRGSTPPANVAITRKGTDTATKARPAIQAARNLPMTISPVVARVTCTGARVAASRSPLIAFPLKVGETSTTRSSVNATTVE